MTTDANENVTETSGRDERTEHRRSTLNYLYFLRFSILLWLSPLLLIILDYRGGDLIKSMVHGLLVLEYPWQFVSAGALVFFTCAAAMVTARIVCAYGPERFNVAPPKRWEVGSQMSWWVVAVFQLPALILSIYLVCRRGELVGQFAGAMGIVAGWALGFSFLFLLTWIHNLFHKPVAENQPYHAVLLPLRGKVLINALGSPPPAYGWGFHRLTKILGAGYCGSDGELHSGHKMAIWLFLFFMTLYTILGFVTAPGFSKCPGTHFPVLASLLFVLLLWGWILAGAAFLADRYRVPVLLLVVVWGFFSADHFYKVKGSAPTPSAKWLTPKMVLKKWEANHPADNDPIIVIAAEGGGIQASAWTARVLAGLEELIPQAKGGFHSSVLLISSVSGGSVAAMDYASQYRLGKDGFSKAHLDCMVDRARAGGLEAVGWGVLYPDFLRIVSGQAWKLGPFVYADRGSSLQKRWLQIRNQSLGNCPPLYAGEAPTLGDWHVQLSSGEMPAVALNATIVETGQRFLLSNFVFQPDYKQNKCPDQKRKDISSDANERDRSANTLHALCPECDLDVITAARLSASFTYVSPVSRAFHEDSSSCAPAFHVADGGYFDDYGVATAIEWLTSAICSTQGLCSGMRSNGPLRPLLLIEIHCCWEHEGSELKSEKRSLALSQVAAPLVTLLKVRSAGQAKHNSNLVELFISAVSGRFEVKHIVIPFQFAQDQCKDSKTISEALQTPLSWHLTRREQENIDHQWDNLLAHHKDKLDPIINAFGIKR